MKKYVIGIDFGTLSARAVVADPENGKELSSATFEYPHGVMDEKLPDGTALPKMWALQHPEDYIEALKNTVPKAIRSAKIKPEQVAGLGIDFTTCTMLPIMKDGTPLCTLNEFKNDPDAYVKLWKHHGAWRETEKINEIFEKLDPERLAVYGGKLSSEWMIPKIAETLNNSPEVYEKAERFIEAGDWLSLILTEKETRSIAFAGFKACWTAQSGYPKKEILEAIDPRMKDLIGTKIPETVNGMDEIAGHLNEKGSELTTLPVGTPLAMPMIDAQAALPALGITESGQMMHILGTSACLITNSDEASPVHGISGYVENGVIPGCTTYEAGQACVGDAFDWFVKNYVPEKYMKEADEKNISVHEILRRKASTLKPGQSGLLALDWFNGNRSVLDDSSLSGMILGLTINTRPEEIYRAIIESTAFGARVILETFESQNITVNEIFAAGGIAKKDEMMMQIYADVLKKPIKIAETSQAGALGSAINAAVASGIYKNMSEAASKMSKSYIKVYFPKQEDAEIYEKLYAEYKTLHDYFGRGGNNVMKRLQNLK